MKVTRILMDMPVSVEIVADAQTDMANVKAAIEAVYTYFHHIDDTFSPFKKNSEVSRLNRGELAPQQYSDELREVLEKSAQTQQETVGFFNIHRQEGTIDPSGLVKGWAIQQAARILELRGFANFSVEAGGDIQTAGVSATGQPWRIGIRHPFQKESVVKVVQLQEAAIATSGSYERGAHIYNPHIPDAKLQDIVSFTVVGPQIYDADRYATAAFAMQRQGLAFLETIPRYEAYMIDSAGMATMTSGFANYVAPAEVAQL